MTNLQNKTGKATQLAAKERTFTEKNAYH